MRLEYEAPLAELICFRPVEALASQTGNDSQNGTGVYVSAGTGTLDGATVLGNTSKSYGGGVFLHNDHGGYLTLKGKVTILNNIVTTFYGDQWVKDAIRRGDTLSYGIFLTLDNAVTSPEEGNTASAAHDPDGFQTGAGGDGHMGSMIQYIVMETLPGDENQARTDTEIYVSTYFSFEDAGVAAEDMNSLTLTKVVQLAAQQYNANQLTEAQAEDFAEFWKKFEYLYPNINVTLRPEHRDGGDET